MGTPAPTVLLPAQTQGILTPDRGGSGYSAAAAVIVAEPWGNTSGSAIPIYSVVRRRSQGTWVDGGIEAVADDTVTDVLGVVYGMPSQTGALDQTTAVPAMTVSAGSGTALVVTSGLTPVLLAADVAAGQWAAPSTTSGKAVGDANPTTTTFGQFVTSGSSGGTAIVRIGMRSGRPTPGGIATLTLEAGDFASAVATGLGTYKAAEYAGTIAGATLMVTPADSVTVDILKANSSIVTTTGTNSICGAAYPSVTSGTYSYMAPTGAWTTGVAIHDTFRLEVRATGGVCTRVTLELSIRQI